MNDDSAAQLERSGGTPRVLLAEPGSGGWPRASLLATGSLALGPTPMPAPGDAANLAAAGRAVCVCQVDAVRDGATPFPRKCVF